MGKFFSVDNLTKCVGGQEKVEEMSINAAANFLSGKVTSSFNAIKNGKGSEFWRATMYDAKTGKLKKEKICDSEDDANKWIKKQKDRCQDEINEIDSNEEKPKVDDLISFSVEHINTQSTFDATMGTAVAGFGAAMSGINMAKNTEMLEGIASALVAECVSIAVSEVTKLVSNAAAEFATMTAETPLLIAKYTQEEFNKEKLSLTDVLKRLTNTDEELMNKQHEELEKERDKKKQNKIATALGNIKKQVDKVNLVVQEKVEKIAPYVTEGPEIVTRMLDDAISAEVQKVKDDIDTRMVKIKKDHHDWCKAQGKIAGQKLANTFNKAVEKQAAKIEAQTKEMTSKVKALAFKAKQIAVLKIMALTGIAVPI